MDEKQILMSYLPTNAVDLVFSWIKNSNVHLKISKNRKTKLGDYRPPIHHPNHRISINHDLNPYTFLITFVHEYAHLLVFEKYKQRVLPHGFEWKSIYKTLMEEVINKDMFPEDIAQELGKSIQNSKASSTSDLNLSRVLRKYDKSVDQLKVEDLPFDAIFKTNTGRKFKKGEKRRIRYKCISIDNGRLYLFHPLTPVVLVLE